MQIIEFLPQDKGSLKGSLSLMVTSWGNFIIEHIAYFKSGEKRWIAFPARQIEEDGKKVWKPYLKFEDAAMQRKFSEKVLEAIDRYLEAK